MDDSILTSIKKLLGIDREYDAFDTDIIVFINSVFSTLYQIGVDLKPNYKVTDDTDEWNDIFSEHTDLIDLIKTYTYMKVRLMFDPPSNSFLLNAIENQIKELEWRINIQAEGGFKDDE